jgi:hypothetical protein
VIRAIRVLLKNSQIRDKKSVPGGYSAKLFSTPKIGVFFSL